MLSFAILASYSFDCCNVSIRTTPIVRRGVYPMDMGGYGFKRLRLILRQLPQLQLQAPVSLRDARAGRAGRLAEYRLGIAEGKEHSEARSERTFLAALHFSFSAVSLSARASGASFVSFRSAAS